MVTTVLRPFDAPTGQATRPPLSQRTAQARHRLLAWLACLVPLLALLALPAQAADTERAAAFTAPSWLQAQAAQLDTDIREAVPAAPQIAREALAAGQPDAWIIMQGHADALALSSKGPDLAEAMRLYLRLGQGAPGENVPEDVWWNAQLGQLLMMEKAERSMERIPTRIQRLRLIDPDLGGTTVRTKFESLLRRTAQKS